MNLLPIGARLVVKPDAPETMTSGGLHIPETAQKKALRGEVYAMGPGMLMKTGARWPMPDVKIGDRVLYMDRSGRPIKIDAIDYLVLCDDDVLAVEETTT